MELHEDKETFKELIAYTSEYFGYNESKIEKDYWISKILKELSLQEFNGTVFFKGGTSLSKAYQIIDRFSEDLDIFVYTGDNESSVSKEKKLTRAVYKFITDNYQDRINTDLSLSGGRFRKAVIAYDPLFSDGGLKKNLEVEIKSCDLKDKTIMFYPSDRKTIQSLVGIYLDETGNSELTEKYGLEAFEIDCLNPRKTICDKLSRITRLSYSDKPIDDISAHIRDVYDLHKIIQNAEYSTFLHSREFLDGLYSVWIEDMNDDMARTHLSLADALLFSNPSEVLENNVFKTAYENGLASLMFRKENMPTLEDIGVSMSIYRDCLWHFDKYREAKTRESRNRISNIEFSTGIIDDKECSIIKCCIDNIQQDWKRISTSDVELTKQGLLSVGMAGLKWFRDELGDGNLSYDKEIEFESQDYIVSVAVRLTNEIQPESCLSDDEKTKVQDYFLQFNRIEEIENALKEIWETAKQMPGFKKTGKWFTDAQDYLKQLSGLGEGLGRGQGLKL